MLDPNKLKDCPFCGSDDVGVFKHLPPGWILSPQELIEDSTRYHCVCKGCDCRTGLYDTVDEAKKVWNRRERKKVYGDGRNENA